ncbi:MAG: DUF190 domain-containing protein [Salinisphaera sp.]|jgi:PII-like signaling protein|nr:DUF190 domain-containing protein [Salinisphaera sp.]
MQGFELVFIAPRSRRHHGTGVIDAIAKLARKQGIKRMTRRVDAEGTGAHGHTHSAHFFELADEPEELMFVLDRDEADQLVAAVRDNAMHVFCLRRQIEYWQFDN